MINTDFYGQFRREIAEIADKYGVFRCILLICKYIRFKFIKS